MRSVITPLSQLCFFLWFTAPLCSRFLILVFPGITCEQLTIRVTQNNWQIGPIRSLIASVLSQSDTGICWEPGCWDLSSSISRGYLLNIIQLGPASLNLWGPVWTSHGSLGLWCWLWTREMLVNSVVSGSVWRMDVLSSALVSDQQGYQYQRTVGAMTSSQIGEMLHCLAWPIDVLSSVHF